MEVDLVNHLEQISPEDWGKTPTSVKKLVEEMAQQIEEQEKKLTEVLTVQEQLLEKINQTSKNSSLPPSSDSPGVEKKQTVKKSSKKRGGQPGHKGNSRELYPIEDCREIIEHHPPYCLSCGEALSGSDINPYRHQIVEIPPISPIVVEHRLHQLTCSACGTKTRATLPEDVNPTGYGVRVVALVALLSGVYRHSHSMVQSAMQEVFGISMSLGTVNKLRLEASKAVASCVDEAKLYIQKAEVVGADETSFNQGNIDGSNPSLRKAWLWVAVTPLVTFFEIALTRCTQGAKDLLGENFGGILNSDRSGVSAELGTALVKQQENLFELWHRVRDGTLSHSDFAELVVEIRSSIKTTLTEASHYSIGTREKTPLAKTVRTCRQLLKVESAMWLFVTTVGVEPTNNAAERAIRPAVIWRRTSFGSQTQAGSNFVARMLTVVTTLKSQKRNVLEFMTKAVVAARGGTTAPSLLPSTTTCSDEKDFLKAA
jgi:transposase